MSSGISYKEHGFWLSNTLCEQVYFYIRARIKVIEPNLYSFLPAEDASIISWIIIGMCPKLEDLISILKSKKLLEKSLRIDETILLEIAKTEEEISELRKAVNATRLLLEGKILLKLDDENASLH